MARGPGGRHTCRALDDGSVDAVCADSTLQHLHAHDVEPALRELRRVLKPNGFAFVQVPDLREVARHVADGRLEEPLYLSPAGPISPLDILYGHRMSLARDPAFSGPRTGFIDTTLAGRDDPGRVRGCHGPPRHAERIEMTAIGFRDDPDEQGLATVATLMPQDVGTGTAGGFYRAAA